MPWASKTLIEARREFVALAQSPNANIRALCRRFHVSAKSGYKVLNRFRTEGDKGLHDRSRKPRHSPSQIDQPTELAVLSVRTEHPLWGGRKIARQLRTQGHKKVPAPSTITSILHRHDYLKSDNAIRTFEAFSGLRYKNHDGLFTPIVRAGFPSAVIEEPDLTILRNRLLSGRVLDRRRAFVILASRRGVRPSHICRLLQLSPFTYRRYLRVFEEGGTAALFARRTNPHRKFDNETIKSAFFTILHQPPHNFGINRTTWRMADLSRVLKEKGHSASEDVIRKILKRSGYRWRKARIVLTSSDPEFSEKLDHIRTILSSLGPDEAFFSIDEYGPFAVKAQPGRRLVGPGEDHLVPQWQRSRGSLIITAALELSSNQVTHFYSTNKNTKEIVRMMEVLVDQNAAKKKIYLSWDAASWHISKELFRRVEEHNTGAAKREHPVVELAPLPARAQFLNVIESVFSGMARAIIQNSDYKSVDDAKSAIDRYFHERNTEFREHPRRAGNKVWGKEREPSKFSEANNCKDPRFG